MEQILNNIPDADFNRGIEKLSGAWIFAKNDALQIKLWLEVGKGDFNVSNHFMRKSYFL